MSFSNILFFLWRLWLWLLVIIGLAAFSPLGIIFISSPKTYPLFHLFCRWWCRLVLLLNGFWYSIKLEQEINTSLSYIICANHTSKFDILLLFAIFPTTFVFVGKRGVTQFPFFEWFYNKTMITFDRSDAASGFRAYRKADKVLKSGFSIVIFPEGQVPEKNIRLQKFKLGAFKLAIHNKVPIIPITFVDNKAKYPENELRLKLGKLRVVIHKPIITKTKQSSDATKISKQVFQMINKTLMNYETK